MNIALDTNIIVYALVGVERTASAASTALERAASHGGAIIAAAPVYAELLAIPNATKPELDTFIAETKIRVDWQLSESCWIAAGIAYAAYAQRRRRQKIGGPRRILADFVIGAHALGVGTLLTADSAFYSTNFPEIRLLGL